MFVTKNRTYVNKEYSLLNSYLLKFCFQYPRKITLVSNIIDFISLSGVLHLLCKITHHSKVLQ